MSRPQNKKELYNLQHAQKRNVVERAFGVFKERFQIIEVGCEYSISIQVRLFLALCALHNFILASDAGDIQIWSVDSDPGLATEPPLTGYERWADSLEFPDLHGSITLEEQEAADIRRDQIAEAMWLSYQEELQHRQEA